MFNQKEITAEQFKTLRPYAIVVSVLIPLVVAILLSPGIPKIPLPFSPYLLPPTYAVINGITAFLLLISLSYIKKGDIGTHQKVNNVAVVFSTVFLVMYVLYHLSTNHTVYGDTNLDHKLDDAERAVIGGWRTFYLIFLNTHIVLAIVTLPMVLFTYLYGWARLDKKHLKIAKITWFFWFYVCVSGVICYFMISPYYPA